MECIITPTLKKEIERVNNTAVTYSDAELKDIQNRAAILAREAIAGRALMGTKEAQSVANAAARKLAIEAEQKLVVGDLVSIKGVDIGRTEQFLANQLGQGAEFFGASPNAKYTVAGEILDDMATRLNTGGYTVDKLIQLGQVRELKKYADLFYNTVEKIGVKGKEAKELFMDSIEVGLIPQHRAGFAIQKQGDVFNMQRYNTFKQGLLSRGLTEEDFNTIIDASTAINAKLDELKLAAEASGVSLGNVHGSGFLPRIFTDNMKRWMERLKANEATQSFILSLGGKDKEVHVANWNWQQSRKTWQWIPEDNKVVAYQLGITEQELGNLINTKQLGKWLHENDVPEAVLDNMVELGSFSKLPMTSREVVDLVKQNYELPFKGMGEIFLDDPVELAQYYANTLSQASAKSYLTKSIVTEGLDAGWAVTAKQYALNPSLYPNFVKVDQSTVKFLYPDYKINPFNHAGDIYMHKAIFDQWLATSKISTDPNLMGQLGASLNYFTRFFSQSALLANGLPYVLRNVEGAFTNFGRGGGNYLRIMDGFKDFMTIPHAGLEALDNTKRIYKLGDEVLTKRELFNRFGSHWGISWIPEQPGTKSNMQWSLTGLAKKPLEFTQALAFLGTYLKEFGVGVDTSKHALAIAMDMLKGEQGKAFSGFAAASNFLENAHKWSLFTSLTDISGANKIGLFLSAQGAPNIEGRTADEVFRMVDDAFINWTKQGNAVYFMNMIKPFSGYAMANPPMQIRMALRRPRAFYNYLKLSSIISQSTTDGQDLKDMNDGILPQYYIDGAPTFLFNDKVNGRMGFLLSTAWNPTEDAITWFSEMPKDVKNLFPGQYNGSVQQQREVLTSELKDNGRLDYFLGKMADQLNPIIRNPLSLMAGIDLRTGKEIDQTLSKEPYNLLGVPVNGLVYFLATTYAPIDRANRSHWFEFATGSPEIIDAKSGKVLKAGTPSWRGLRRVAFKRDEYTGDDSLDFATKLSSLMGFNLKILDVARNQQWTFTDVKKSIGKFDTEIAKTDQAIRKMKLQGEDVKYPDVYKEQQNNIRFLMEGRHALEFDLLTTYYLMKKSGTPSKQAFDDLLNKSAQQIPNIAADEKGMEILQREGQALLDKHMTEYENMKKHW